MLKLNKDTLVNKYSHSPTHSPKSLTGWNISTRLSPILKWSSYTPPPVTGRVSSVARQDLPPLLLPSPTLFEERIKPFPRGIPGASRVSISNSGALIWPRRRQLPRHTEIVTYFMIIQWKWVWLSLPARVLNSRLYRDRGFFVVAGTGWRKSVFYAFLITRNGFVARGDCFKSSLMMIMTWVVKSFFYGEGGVLAYRTRNGLFALMWDQGWLWTLKKC